MPPLSSNGSVTRQLLNGLMMSEFWPLLIASFILFACLSCRLFHHCHRLGVHFKRNFSLFISRFDVSRFGVSRFGVSRLECISRSVSIELTLHRAHSLSSSVSVELSLHRAQPLWSSVSRAGSRGPNRRAKWRSRSRNVNKCTHLTGRLPLLLARVSPAARMHLLSPFTLALYYTKV